MGDGWNKKTVVKGFESPVLITYKEILLFAEKNGTRTPNHWGRAGGKKGAV